MRSVTFLLSVLSGVLLTLGFPTPEMFYLSWVALLPLFVALRNSTEKGAFRLGFVCGLTHYVTALYWIQYVLQRYGSIPLPLAVFLLVLLSGYLALYPACFAYIARKWQDHSLLWIFGLPGVWVGLEWIRGYVLTGFPWANLGYTQTPFALLIQFADITGVYGVSWLVVLGNTTLMSCLNRNRTRWSLPVFALCMLAAIVYGSWRLAAIHSLQNRATPWTVGVIQGNIDQARKWDPAFQQETLKRYRELSLAAAQNDPRPDFLVWPETAAPFFYGVEEALTGQVNEIVRDMGVPLLFGSPAVSLVDGKPRLQNRAYLVDGKAGLMGAYAKQHLVPFGEYVPLQKILFFVNRLVEAAGDFVPGHTSEPLVVNGKALGILICYEGIFPDLARRTVREGAMCLVNITNDAWYGNTAAPYQHLEIERWRTIEFRVPMIRAANTGISTVFDATGAPCDKIPLNEQGELVCSVRPVKQETFYAQWGDLFGWLCILTSIGGLLYSSWNRRVPRN